MSSEVEVEAFIIEAKDANKPIMADAIRLQRMYDSLIEIKRMNDDCFAIYSEDPEIAADLRAYMKINYPKMRCEWICLGEI